MTKTAKDYPVTFPYGATDDYWYGPKGKIGPYHRGDDREMPTGTPVVINGVQIGLSGATGTVSGPHIHIGKYINGADHNPRGLGFTFKSAVVHSVDNLDDDANGKWVRLNADGAYWVYLHLSKVTCKPGQKLVPSKPKPASPKPVYTTVRPGEGLSHIARRAGYKDWWSPTSWIRLSRLNGKGLNWVAYNRSLKAGQKIRVR